MWFSPSKDLLDERPTLILYNFQEIDYRKTITNLAGEGCDFRLLKKRYRLFSLRSMINRARKMKNHSWYVNFRAVLILAVLASCCVLFLAGCAATNPTSGGNAELSLSWTPPVLNKDGSDINDELFGFRIYYGTKSGIYTKVAFVNDPTVTQTVIGNLRPGDYYLAVTALNIYGNESDYSNQIVKTAVSDI